MSSIKKRKRSNPVDPQTRNKQAREIDHTLKELDDIFDAIELAIPVAQVREDPTFTPELNELPKDIAHKISFFLDIVSLSKYRGTHLFC